MNPTLLSLYSGVGGMDLAAHWAGIEIVAHCEADAWNRSILARHWPGVPTFESDEQVTAGSLRELGITHVDIVAGGPPCQPFSVAGKRDGTVDPRHRWPEMARIVDELRPAFVVVENVAGFTDVAEQLVRADLESLGYRTVRFDIPAAGVGAPHKRERIFVVAYAGERGRARRSSVREGESDPGRCSQNTVAAADRTVRLESEPVTGCGGSPIARDAGGVGNTDERGRGVERLATEQADAGAIAERSGDEGGAVADAYRGGREGIGSRRLFDGERPAHGHDSDGRRSEATVADTHSTRRGERRRAESIRAELFAAERGSDDLELDVQPCSDGDGRWDVGSGYDLCVDDAGLARIRAEHADAIAAGEYGRPLANSCGAGHVPRTKGSRDVQRDTLGGGSAAGSVAEPTDERRERNPRVRREAGGRPELERGRLTESRLGGVSRRLTDRLDSTRWPAPRGAAQHEWEPSRVTTERENRRKRLKALGNICLPQQAYPLFECIAALLREEEVAA